MARLWSYAYNTTQSNSTPCSVTQSRNTHENKEQTGSAPQINMGYSSVTRFDCLQYLPVSTVPIVRPVVSGSANVPFSMCDNVHPASVSWHDVLRSHGARNFVILHNFFQHPLIVVPQTDSTLALRSDHLAHLCGSSLCGYWSWVRVGNVESDFQARTGPA